MKELTDMIAEFGKAPDGQLDASLSKECREFDGEDPVRFLRNLRDKCVRYAGSTGFVIKVISALLSGYPDEPEDEMAERRRQLEAAEKKAP